MLAATVRVTRDFDLAEECVQDAFAQALTTWETQGIPARPGAWLTTVAHRRSLDILRRAATLRRALPLLVVDDEVPSSDQEYPDDRLRLICTCCHPTLAVEAQVALTLRLICGLTTGEVARAFLVSETTMAARITRAKKKIAAARIPYRVPPMSELSERINAVLAVAHLLFTTGHTAPAGETLIRSDLVERALDLVRMLRTLLPLNPDVAGLLALILLTDARRSTRVGSDGRMLQLAEQDRSRWNHIAITEGIALVREAISSRPPGHYALQAAIAAVHAEAPSYEATDWQELVGLYDLLVQVWPSPVVGLNRAVAIGMAHGPSEGLNAVDTLSAEPQLVGYSYLPAARAHFLERLGRNAEARCAYEKALDLTENDVERTFLVERLKKIVR